MKTAIIGLGVIGSVHKTVLNKLGENLVAVCDVNKKKLAGLKEKTYTDYIELLEKEKPDVVHVCTPHYLHAETITEALSRDINVLCEKPLCIKAEDIPRIIRVEKKSKGILGVCHQNRYNAANAYVKEYLKDKEIVSAHGSVVWNRDAAYYAQDAWRGKKATEGGGVLINQALHTLDLMQWFCGMPDSVTASVDNLSLKGVIEVEDTASLLCKGKTNFTFFATNAGGADMPVEVTIRLKNGDVVAVYPDRLMINGKSVCAEVIDNADRKCCYGNGHEKLVADFYECVRTGVKFPIDGEESAKVIKIILAAYESGVKPVKIR